MRRRIAGREGGGVGCQEGEICMAGFLTRPEENDHAGGIKSGRGPPEMEMPQLRRVPQALRQRRRAGGEDVVVAAPPPPPPQRSLARNRGLGRGPAMGAEQGSWLPMGEQLRLDCASSGIP